MHKLNWRSWPLTVKLIVAMTAMVVLAAAIVTLLSISREQQTFQAELEDKAKLLVQTLSVSVADPLIKLRRGRYAELNAKAWRRSDRASRPCL